MEFKNLGENIGDENESFILLNSLPDVYREAKVALKYERESISTDGIISEFKTKELELLASKRESSSAEGHFAKGKTKNNDKGKPKIRCNYCHKIGHLKRDCYSLKKKQNWKNQKAHLAEAW